MLKKWYIYMAVLAFSAFLFFPTRAEAATSNISVNGYDLDNNLFQVRGQSFSGLRYDEIYSIDGSDYPSFKWNLSQNHAIAYLQNKNYYTGMFQFTVNIPSTYAFITDVNIDSTFVCEGVHCFIVYQTSTYYQVMVIFDNYYADGSFIGLPTIEFSMVYNGPQTTADTITAFNTSLSISANNSVQSSPNPWLRGYAGVLQNMIEFSIDDSTAISDIISTLELIRTQDYNYYYSIVNQLSAVNNNLVALNQMLSTINSNMNADFAAVQTVLDLFPSYRTQVLQYWQELLQMNAAQSSEAAEVESEYQDKEQQSATLAAGMAVDIPSYQASDFNILSHVDSAQQNNFFGLLGMIANNSFISTLLLIAVTGMVVGFILYGKKT